MGDSDKLETSGPGSYRFVEHRAYLDDLLAELGVTSNVTFVVHDWGSALGFDWAERHRDAVKGIAYMEAIVRPVTWDDWPPPVRQVFQGFRSPAGEQMVLEQNVFVEQILPGAVLRDLGAEEMAVYRRPYLEPGIVRGYGEWLAGSGLPKLFVNAEPGAILRGSQRDFCRGWPNQEEVTVKGSHFIQEDSPEEIGRAVARWLGRVS
jgi:haloalkane dehalogenase